MIEYDEMPDIDLATRNMLSMIEIVVIEMGEAAKKAWNIRIWQGHL